MSDIEALKEQARRHEQEEEWQQACEFYVRALDRAGEDREPDIGLHNRVGDLQIRLGSFDEAVRHFEKAVDLYLESGLPNNAIAVCKKLLRHLPHHLATHRRMAQIRASQGFMLDARGHVLTYAEKMQAAGNTEEALEALVDFAEMAPEDTEIRMSVALQLLQHDRPDEAMEQLRAGYRILVARGDESGAAPFQEKILALDPGADLSAPTDVPHEGAGGTMSPAEGHGPASDEPPEEDVSAQDDLAFQTPASGDGLAFDATPSDGDLAFEATALGGAGDEEGFQGFGVLEVEGNDVPDESDTLGGDLPLIPLDEDDGVAASSGLPSGAESPPASGSGTSLEDWEALHEALSSRPATRSEAEDLVELAFRLGDRDRVVQSYLVLADSLRRDGDADGAQGVLEQVLSLDPDNPRAREALAQAAESGAAGGEPDPGASSGDAAADAGAEPGGDFVDLGALVFDEPRGEGTTRFTVEYQEPSGDEDLDFSRVLDQFKAKVSENFDHEDVRSHHDLGTAYKEMGLLDEAVEKFQEALRAAPGHLPTYELLGQVFMEQGEDRAAVRVLERALRIPTLIEDDFLGIYYYLARAHERLGNTGDAVDFYDRVFALDINFADVTDRLRRLR